jgi:hypothetical protein
MSIADVKDALVTLETAYLAANAAGKGRAYAQFPMVLNDFDLPAFINYSRDATYNQTQGGDVMRVTRDYAIQMLIFPAAEGTTESGGGNEGEALVEPHIEKFWKYFAARPQIDTTEPILRASIVSDTGPRRFEFAGGLYWGVEFRAQVEEFNPRTYAAGE